MKALIERKKLRADLLSFRTQQARMSARPLHRAFPNFSARARKESAIHPSALSQPQRKLRLARMKEKIRSMKQRLALPSNRFFNRRMPIPQRVDADAAKQIEIAPAILVDQIHAFAALKEQG